ncbi:MAG: hemin uptake protein HemP [Candidatus Nitrotoga sp.]
MNGSNKLKAVSTSTTQPPMEKVVQVRAVQVPDGVLRISSKQLFSRGNEIEIDHNGMSYWLRQTSLGKLILTK